MNIWIARIALFTMLFGLSASTYAGNHGSALLNALTNLSPLIAMAIFVRYYFELPGFYKVMAWVLVLSVILLVLESKYEYDQFVYSYFVIKRFAYCGVALCCYYLASRAGLLKIEYAVYLIFGFFFFNQLLLGQIFSYNLTSESRTTLSPDALYLVIPFIYYLVLYLRERRLRQLMASLFTLFIIIFLLHRTVISAAVVAASVIVGISFLGKVTINPLPVWRTLILFTIMLAISLPFTDLLPESKVTSFMENINGIFDPKEDNTGSWRVEQSTYYLSQVPEKPIFGWRYEGYDRGEIMENEDFPDKGTIIHSQYVDMLYNYGAFGLAINLILMLSAIIALYFSRRVLTVDQLVLFGFLVSGVVYGISYQEPVYFWGFVGVSMFYGLHPPLDSPEHEEVAIEDEDIDEYDSPKTIAI
ncbi:O-antigen ligase family protein [Spirosoma oryzicola]|uniref:O-antigen ligase family protein n=1 Tax=Spirosoma oryzicola TaxID=2898794 RepID=UPI001E5C2B97|nr:O-antigen ligase family protein [Spirosoma oryzicola]UHG90345.1 O-antigen ligase family protein [Spirosoma oryzicola]